MCLRKAKPLKRREIVVILLLIFVVFSCAPKLVPPEIEHAADLQLFDESQGLKIGVSAYINPKQSRKTFGIDLFSKGILPILVSIENNTGSDFLLRKKLFSLYQRETDDSSSILLSSTTDTTAKKVGSSSDAEVTASTTVLGAAGVATFTVHVLQAGGATETVAWIASRRIPVLAIGAVASILLGIEGEIASRDKMIINNMTAIELADRTLLQGQSTQGFLYFTWDSTNEKISPQEFILRNTLQIINEKKVWQVDIPIGPLFPQEQK